MRTAVSLMVFVLGLAPYQEVRINETTLITYDTAALQPNIARLESLIDIYFELVLVARPERVEIRFLTYKDFEIEFAKSQAGPNWRPWLRQYQTQRGTRLASGFVKPDDRRRPHGGSTPWIRLTPPWGGIC